MATTSWCVKNLLKVTTRYLEEKGIESPRLDAEVLLAHQLDLDRIALYLNFDQPLTDEELTGYRSLIRRRATREPLQYITGIQEFWSMEMAVCPDVLIPRPETEILVEQAIDLTKGFERNEGEPLHILELGTGCGAIAVALAKEVRNAAIWATDISCDALRVALENAVTHGVLDQIRFITGDLFNPLKAEKLVVDLIVSNPPYVSKSEWRELSPEIRNHEPVGALDGGEHGMDFLEKIIAGAMDFLNPGGWIVLEMAPHQTQKALDFIEKTASYEKMEHIKDYSGRYRVVRARRKGGPST